MTEQQLFMKIDELARDLPRIVIISAKKIRESGVVDYESYGNNYILPKLTMVAILQALAIEYMPLAATKKQKFVSEIKNMARFA